MTDTSGQAMTLEHWRKQRVLTLRELAAKADVTQQTLVNVAAGKSTRISTMRRIAAALEVDVHQVQEFRVQLDS